MGKTRKPNNHNFVCNSPLKALISGTNKRNTKSEINNEKTTDEIITESD